MIAQKFVIENLVDINAQDNEGYSPMMRAAENRYLELQEFKENKQVIILPPDGWCESNASSFGSNSIPASNNSSYYYTQEQEMPATHNTLASRSISSSSSSLSSNLRDLSRSTSSEESSVDKYIEVARDWSYHFLDRVLFYNQETLLRLNPNLQTYEKRHTALHL